MPPNLLRMRFVPLRLTMAGAGSGHRERKAFMATMASVRGTV